MKREGLPDVQAVLRSGRGVAAAQCAAGQANAPKELHAVPPSAGDLVPVGTKTCRLIFLIHRIQRWETPKGCFASETPFAPRDGAVEEDDGYLVTNVTILNYGRGECAIFDARDITPDPICRVILPHHIPMGAHTCWTPQAALAGVPEERRAPTIAV